MEDLDLVHKITDKYIIIDSTQPWKPRIPIQDFARFNEKVLSNLDCLPLHSSKILIQDENSFYGIYHEKAGESIQECDACDYNINRTYFFLYDEAYNCKVCIHKKCRGSLIDVYNELWNNNKGLIIKNGYS